MHCIRRGRNREEAIDEQVITRYVIIDDTKSDSHVYYFEQKSGVCDNLPCEYYLKPQPIRNQYETTTR